MKRIALGVIVGRFQTPYLHFGHKHLVEAVKLRCEKVLVVLGVGGGWADKRDPLDFETRSLMIQATYPELIIERLHDHSSDIEWSKNLDVLIDKNANGGEVALFGSRDCFAKYYSGKYRYLLIEEVPNISATALRKDSVVLDTVDFRKGVIYAATNQNFPTSFQTVDVVICHSLEDKVLVARKTGEEGWRFVGGFVDPKDYSLESAARREVREEAGDIEIANLIYLASRRVNDLRYRNSEHKIMTALFAATYVFGRIEAKDDIDEIRWQDRKDLLDCLLPEHKPLGEIFLKMTN